MRAPDCMEGGWYPMTATARVNTTQISAELVGTGLAPVRKRVERHKAQPIR